MRERIASLAPAPVTVARSLIKTEGLSTALTFRGSSVGPRARRSPFLKWRERGRAVLPVQSLDERESEGDDAGLPVEIRALTTRCERRCC
jgi:hypothetical protein